MLPCLLSLLSKLKRNVASSSVYLILLFAKGEKDCWPKYCFFLFYHYYPLSFSSPSVLVVCPYCNLTAFELRCIFRAWMKKKRRRTWVKELVRATERSAWIKMYLNFNLHEPGSGVSVGVYTISSLLSWALGPVGASPDGFFYLGRLDKPWHLEDGLWPSVWMLFTHDNQMSAWLTTHQYAPWSVCEPSLNGLSGWYRMVLHVITRFASPHSFIMFLSISKLLESYI